MFRARLLALAAALAALSVGQLSSPASAAAQDVYVVPASGAYSAYGEPSAQPRYAGLAPFLEALSPFGTWVELPTVGLAWKPDDSRVGATFVPYLTNGHWTLSDVGWVFESDFEWGYATFHYGRWLFDGQWGWVWAPDTEWGASWVDWRVAEGYVGWAPLPPPGYAYSAGYGPSYTFVSVTYLTYVDLTTYILPAPATVYWTERSAPCTTVWSGAGRTWPAGPQLPAPPRGVVRVNPPTSGVVQVRPPSPSAAAADRVHARGGSFVDLGPGARVGVSGPHLPPGAPPWGANGAPPPPSAPPPPPARPRFGVQRTVLPPRYEAPPPAAQPVFAPPVVVRAPPQQPAFAPPQQPAFAPPQQPAFAPRPPTFAQPQAPTFAQPTQPQRPTFSAPVPPRPPTFAQPTQPAQPWQPPPPAQPPRPSFAQPVEPQRPAFGQQHPGLVQPLPPPAQQPPLTQPLPAAPIVARPPPQIVVPPSAIRGRAQVR